MENLAKQTETTDTSTGGEQLRKASDLDLWLTYICTKTRKHPTHTQFLLNTNENNVG